MNYKESIDYITNIERCGSDYGIERMRELLELLGNPDYNLKFIHIAGTNGKGSTSTYITSILVSAGYKVGSYNSPSVFNYNERFSINGQELSNDDIAHYFTILKDVITKEQLRRKENNLSPFTPTAFEIETALAFMCFYDKKVDICVVEVGLGGRWDATNVIEKKELAVITPIGLDHCALLGNTLGEIASEKAAISKGLIITINQANEIMESLKNPYKIVGDKKEYIKTKVITIEEPVLLNTSIDGQRFMYKGQQYEIKMLGVHQIFNAALAIETINNLNKKGWTISEKAIKDGLMKASIGGRFEIVNSTINRFKLRIPSDKLLVLDGSHNPQGALTLKKCIELYLKGKSACMVFGMFKDKDVEQVASILTPLVEDVICTQAPKPRGIDYNELFSIVSKYNDHVYKEENIINAIKEGFKKDDVVIVCGSFSLMKCLGD